ncbi:MAG: RNA polymerase sigma factor [Planctomycetaceae bacterium]
MAVLADAKLVEAAMAGDRDAFAVLVERYQRLVIAGAAGILGDRHAAQDVAQEAFVAAYQKLATLRNPAAFGAWVLRIARREASRATRRRKQLLPLCEDAMPDVSEVDGRLDRDSTDLLNFVDRLPERERVAVMLKYFDEHPVGDIAGMTGQSVGTVTKTLTRARKRLQTWLERDDP